MFKTNFLHTSNVPHEAGNQTIKPTCVCEVLSINPQTKPSSFLSVRFCTNKRVSRICSFAHTGMKRAATEEHVLQMFNTSDTNSEIRVLNSGIMDLQAAAALTSLLKSSVKSSSLIKRLGFLLTLTWLLRRSLHLALFTLSLFLHHAHRTQTQIV